ncbi:MAG: hypothetical protein WEB52_01605 [Dehalococcoidia bacterium]
MEGVSDPFTPRPIPEDLRSQWRDKGFPEDLLDRAAAVRIPHHDLARHVQWASAEQATLYVGWMEHTANGAMRWRQAVFSDNDEFIDLWANAPEQIGDWDVTVERGPNAFAQFSLQERVVLPVLFDRGVMVACVSWSLRNTIVGGRKLGVRYGQALRVHQAFRRAGYGNWVRSVPWPIGVEMPTHTQYDYIRSHNQAVVEWWKRYTPGIMDNVPERADNVPGVPVTVMQYPAAQVPHDASGIRAATADDLPRCVELINRTLDGLDLVRPYSVEFLQDRLDEGCWGDRFTDRPPVYRWGEFYVLEERGRIVACGGLWDRGRDLRERWRHRDTREERMVDATALIDFGYESGAAPAVARLIEHFIGQTHDLGRTFHFAPLEQHPEVAALLERHAPVPETRYLQWRMADPKCERPFADLVYW